MPGASIQIKIEDQEVKSLLGRLGQKLGNLTPAMKKIGAIMLTSVQRNFEVGGRPKWRGLSAITLAHRKGRGAGPLVVKGFGGGLLGSITYRAEANRVMIGTNKIYAGVYQFGATKGQFGKDVEFHVPEYYRRVHQGKFRRSGAASRSGATLYSEVKRKVLVRAHTRHGQVPWGNVPARPFLMVQDEDWTEMRASLTDFLRGGNES